MRTLNQASPNPGLPQDTRADSRTLSGKWPERPRKRVSAARAAEEKAQEAMDALLAQTLAILAGSTQIVMTPRERRRKMRKMGLVPGDELDEQFMSRWADQTDRGLAHHKMAKKYAPEGEAMGLDLGTAYGVAPPGDSGVAPLYDSATRF